MIEVEIRNEPGSAYDAWYWCEKHLKMYWNWKQIFRKPSKDAWNAWFVTVLIQSKHWVSYGEHAYSKKVYWTPELEWTRMLPDGHQVKGMQVIFTFKRSSDALWFRMVWG